MLHPYRKLSVFLADTLKVKVVEETVKEFEHNHQYAPVDMAQYICNWLAACKNDRESCNDDMEGVIYLYTFLQQYSVEKPIAECFEENGLKHSVADSGISKYDVFENCTYRDVLMVQYDFYMRCYAEKWKPVVNFHNSVVTTSLISRCNPICKTELPECYYKTLQEYILIATKSLQTREWEAADVYKDEFLKDCGLIEEDLFEIAEHYVECCALEYLSPTVLEEGNKGCLENLIQIEDEEYCVIPPAEYI